MFLELGLKAPRASATSAVIILVAVSSDVVHYAVLGLLGPLVHFAVWVGCIGFVAALLGRFLAVRWVARSLGRPSLLIFTLALVLLVCAALALRLAVKNIVHTTAWSHFDSRGLCG